MSHYTKVRTQIRDAEALKRAIEDMGYPCEEADYDKDLPLYGYQGDKREQTADIVIRRESISPSSNDIGFKKDDEGNYEIIISEYDARIKPRFVQEVTQRYAYNVIVDTAEEQGFSVTIEETTEDGSLRVVVQRW